MLEKHPHRKLVQHNHEQGDFHELTFSCYKRMPLLTNDDWRKRLSENLDAACEAECFELVAFVFMPEHVHLLVYPRLPDPNIGRFLARVKQPTSKSIKETLIENSSELLHRLTIRERPGKTTFRFWQEGPGFDRNLYSTKAISASIDYFHMNPVNRGLCDKAVDYKWSSARYYLLEPPKQQFPSLPHIHGIPPGTFDEGQPRY